MSHLWIYNSYLPLHLSSCWRLSIHLYIQYWYIYIKDSVALHLKHFGGHMGVETQQKMQWLISVVAAWCPDNENIICSINVFVVTHFSTSAVSVLWVKGEESIFPGFPHLLTKEFPWTVVSVSMVRILKLTSQTGNEYYEHNTDFFFYRNFKNVILFPWHK